MQRVIILVFICFLASCSHYSPEIEKVLKQAGDNRHELEQVLKHYSKNPADSLKLCAAEFLIVNMPGKYSEYYDAPWNDIAVVCLRWTSSSDKQMVMDAYGLGEPVIQEDVKYITADYLINNIDLAFKVWREQPWGRHIPFDTFCEEILPYRVSAEPLEDWRKKALASFADINRSFQKQPYITAVEACRKVNQLLPRFNLDPDFPPMSYSQLMASTRGTCDDIAMLPVFVMRALGIPVTVDYTPKWPNMNVGHTWNSVSDSAGRHISFEESKVAPGNPHRGIWGTKSKVYRQMFANRKLVNTDNKNIPAALQNPNMQDVTSEYEGSADIEISMRYAPADNTGYAYLATFGEQQWNTVAFGTVEGQAIRFAAAGKNVVYLPLFYANGVQTVANIPFFLNTDGTIRYFEADTAHLQPVSLRETHPTDMWTREVMRQGRFEGANRPDFSDARLLYTIDMPETSFNIVKLQYPVACRYVRYVAPPNLYGDVAEIRFYAEKGQRLRGVSIGTPGSYGDNPANTCEKAYDDDLATYSSAAQNNGAWTGLDLGKAHNIYEIHYYPRNTGGSITANMYELFYWEGDGWKSWEKRQGTGYPLDFQVPSNAVFYLRNIAANGDYKRIFFVKDGQPQWR
ncbi:hypothetical protein FACS189430_09640 [Bacteroidia bacterium]|nr:hypothetical protein FACS189430_09640 [Bacteroidia bacterium]